MRPDNQRVSDEETFKGSPHSRFVYRAPPKLGTSWALPELAWAGIWLLERTRTSRFKLTSSTKACP